VCTIFLRFGNCTRTSQFSKNCNLLNLLTYAHHLLIMNYLTSTLILISIGCINICSAKGDHTHDWDFLVFTQHWPLTVCLQWTEEHPKHSCRLPSLNNIWTVHGIWPTKIGEWGPQFCNSSLHFNKTQLDPIKEQLQQYWIDIHNGSTYSLWLHEWEKHGTCATALPTLDTEDKYFGQGLKWIKQYEMKDILSQSGIEPNVPGYFPQDIWNAVQKSLGKNPTVQCHIDPKTKLSYLFEIRICFDKNFTLIDCEGTKGPSEPMTGMKTNCPLDKTIMYPGLHSPEYEKPIYVNIDPVYHQHSWLLEAWKITQFVQWVTMKIYPFFL